MKLCGHTMGMPDKDIFESISFCAELGLDGIEVRCARDGQMHLDALTADDIARIRDHAQAEGVEFACLTPYYRDFMTPEAAEATLDGYRLACGIARELGCPIVRAISGTWPLEGYQRDEVFALTVAGTREAAIIADDHGVALAVETHGGQLTFSATETFQFVESVDHPALGVLWDPYWVHVRGEETVAETLELIGPRIVHVHAKNVRFDEGGGRHTVLLDEGELDWCEIVARLAAIGYDAYLSDEYEKFWHPEELPGPEVGMARNRDVLRECLARLS
ncbi:MAG: sugar phosphate isomerase/epimerase family protein [Armatimonadota bacterium]